MTIKYQKQTKFGLPGGEGETGNCFSTCVAALLGMNTEDVPNFCALPEEIWWEEAVKWMRERHLDLVSIKSLGQMICAPNMTFIASGPSPRNPKFDHAVICRVRHDFQFEILMDPHPENTGLAGDFTDACFIVPYWSR